MNTIFFKSFLLLAALCLALATEAQEKIIHGIVTTFDSIPLIDAEVQVRSTKHVVLTDSLGRFSVAINPGDRLKVSASGFYTQKVKLEEKTKIAAINLKLKPGEKNREYAIGYGHVSDRDKLNALASLNSKDMDFSQYSNIYDLIKGRFAGVQITNGEIIIRGINSINSSSAALIIVDGVPVDGSALSSIPPVQVKSINVIKDGSSAIYGSRGANGVVLIETKRGNDQ
ncbi:TonB-dependent outer membrane receptor, SusC/RagA subfamily, signature region [Mariniphaga anaerophila]|uniref:TonB-dependent outer membrane receptor, SusC/RagA subfamily, signature region n=1 Tax=Mariniphaga anaerophila TaxID=1484053 RepID=A0A1M5A105_9BACT|nr:TonB-dependent receptor plug domain-containing protein [Mariniphaga anaerophila]SHF23955.1 TonB-dependent outer membrane receptor, SusC/RagA subfamily, signature region [Mariniphaga anaerophila]